MRSPVATPVVRMALSALAPQVILLTIDMAASMLASTLGVEFDDVANWDEKEQVFKISGEIVRTFNVTQSAVISAKGWTTVVASAVFLF